MNHFYFVLFVFAFLCGLCSAKLGYFWHLSDNHVQDYYKENSDPTDHCIRGKGDAGKFGHYDCFAPYPIEYTAFSLIPTLRPDECVNENPMFILWTGDIVAFHDEYAPSDITWDLQNVTVLLQKLQKDLGANIPVYPVIGNHDSSPQNQLKAEGDWVYTTLAEMWKPFLPSDCLASLKKSGYYSLKVKNNLRLIVLNTVLYYELNNQTIGQSDPGGQIKWLAEQLAIAKKNNEYVYIAGHVPPRGMGGCFRPEYGKPFLDAMKGYHNIIKGSFWGHCHQDSFQLVGNITSGDYHVGHLAPTLGTNWYTDPAFRRFMIDVDTYEVQNWRTFYMHLPDANKEGKIKWNVLYDAKKSYGLADGTPKSMYSFIKGLQTNTTAFNLVYSRIKSGAYMSACDSQCKKRYICSMLYPHMYGYDECLKR